MSWLKLTFELGGLEETQAVYFLSPRFHFSTMRSSVSASCSISDFKAVSNPLCRVAVLKIQHNLSIF